MSLPEHIVECVPAGLFHHDI